MIIVTISENSDDSCYVYGRCLIIETFEQKREAVRWDLDRSSFESKGQLGPLLKRFLF
jgi:hypothetical protein